MPLTPTQRQALISALRSYAFPSAHFDFVSGLAVVGLSMLQLESRVRSDLVSGSDALVKNGLSNVLYWGYAQMGGLAQVRVSRFRAQATPSQLRNATTLFTAVPRPSLQQIHALRLPEFSGVSFVSKIRMFLDPAGSATLDQQIMKIHTVRPTTVLSGIRYYKTSIPVTAANSRAYEDWCDRLSFIRMTYAPSHRVVDVERALFALIQAGQVANAAGLLADA